MTISASQNPARYRLSDHVRACAVGAQVVLLDMKRSKYLGIGERQCQSLSSVIEGWPCSTGAHGSSSVGFDLRKFLAPLVAQKLVTDRPAVAHAQRPSIDAATASAAAHDAWPDSRIGAHHLRGFLSATASSALSLRCCSLQNIADRVTARRNKREGAQAQPCAADRLQASVTAFDRLRPLLLTARDQCLYDSLALIHFLAHQSLFPRWVVGVRTHPFRAHSWVQEGHLVLNDLHENVRPFTPILVV